MINNIKAAGKFLDQPLLIAKLNKAMPKIVLTGAASIWAKNAHNLQLKANYGEIKKEEAKKEAKKRAIVILCAVISALCAPKLAGAITKRAPLDGINKVKEKNKNIIDEFIKTQNINTKDDEELTILQKAKEKVLSFKEVKFLNEKYSKNPEQKDFFNKLIPEPENIKAKDIFSEIGYLSIYGAIPVAGGVIGGVTSDIIQKEDFKKNLPDKINEGIYQYLANIFMCNIGAGLALSILEKMNITSKSARALGMSTGIILTGVIGGSKIANFISKKIIQPFINKDKEPKERTPEILDLGLHTDDIATVSLLSGLKWIEPSLPVLYSVSGYRAGIGYRN